MTVFRHYTRGGQYNKILRSIRSRKSARTPDGERGDCGGGEHGALIGKNDVSLMNLRSIRTIKKVMDPLERNMLKSRNY
jgi:hypothetical protein